MIIQIQLTDQGHGMECSISNTAEPGDTPRTVEYTHLIKSGLTQLIPQVGKFLGAGEAKITRVPLDPGAEKPSQN